MGLLSRAATAIRSYSLEDPAQPLLPWSALTESLGIGKSDAGVMVNEKQAMRLATAFACINVISTDLSSIDFSVFQTLPDGSIREATEHRLYPILHTQPNPRMTSMTWRATMLASALGWGNAYSYIRRDNANRVVSLEPLPPDRTNPTLINRDNGRGGELVYVTTATADGMPTQIAKENIFHIMGMSLDGYVGLSPIGTCKNAFGLALAAEKYGAQFFANGARSSGVFSHPGELEAEAQENLKKSIREMSTGDNALRPIVLEEGMTWTPNTIPPNEAQFLQTRGFQRSEIAGLYRVAMHLLQDLSRSTNNNIEHQSLDHIRYCLRPWAVKIEVEAQAKLLQWPYHAQHDFNDFQRGDFASQTAGFTALRNIGVYSSNDIFKAMHQNPISAAEGGDLRVVSNQMVSLETLAAMPAPPQLTDGGNDTTSDTDQGTPITDRHCAPIVNSFQRLFRDAIGRIVNRDKPDEKFAYRALQPLYASMAASILASHQLTPTLTADDERAIAEMVTTAARTVWQYNKQNATKAANAETAAAYTALRQKLIGEA